MLTTFAPTGIRLCARDHARTPMQWDSSPQAGFSTNENTWMRVMDSYVDINAAAQVSAFGLNPSWKNVPLNSRDW